VHDFEGSDRWPRGTNASFISFIPKVDNPQHLNEFRLISLVMFVQNLPLRLKKVLNKVIDDRQFAFLEGRGLMDNVLVTNKVLDDVKRKKSSCVLFKVDYDTTKKKITFSDHQIRLLQAL